MSPVSRIALLPLVALFGTLFLIAGCGNADDPASTRTTSDASATPLPDDLFLATAPDDVTPIATLKQSAKAGDRVTVHVVVGGRVSPIVEGRASATIVDATMHNTCLGGDDHCTTPWDYCCEPRDTLTNNMATLQVVDETGRVLAADLTKHLGSGSTLIAQGRVAPRPTDQVLAINATGIHIVPAQSR